EAINDAKTRAAAKREFKVSLSQMDKLREKLAENDRPLQPGLDYSPEYPNPAETAASRSQLQKNAPVKLTPGVKVKTRLGHVGIIEKIENSTAELIVGNFRLKEKLGNLSPIEPESNPGRPPARSQTTQFKIDADNSVPTEINLIGKTVLEAESELERFIDRAYAAAQRRVRIIHGHGTGTLRRFVADYLKNHPLVESFAYAAADRGGSGATEVNLLK
ncbi:MAG TPA: Smr/MutS family protein, partial [Pyrinomonadaceae bacterium]|nr:Smr/MutS family protein [Pyrinomonadaceae bacterium]